MIYNTCPRSLYSFLLPPKGYQLEKLVCTTYSLNLSVAFDLAAAIHFPAEDTPDLKDVALLEKGALKETARKKLLIFYQWSNLTAFNSVLREQYNALATCCCQQISPDGKAFHSKLMLACFRKEGGDWYYRLRIGSKNLSGGDALEFAICTESCADSGNANDTGVVLHGFLGTFLQNPENGEDWYTNIKDQEFRYWPDQHSDDTCSNLLFAYNAGKGSTILDALQCELNNLGKKPTVHAISPFLTPDQNYTLYLSKALAADVYYKTNGTEVLQNAQAALIDAYPQKIHLSDVEHFVHGKMYFWRLPGQERCYRVWLGSANASANGFEKNSEFMAGFDWNAPADNTANHKYYDEDNAASGERFLLCGVSASGISTDTAFDPLAKIKDWTLYTRQISEQERMEWELRNTLGNMSAKWDDNGALTIANAPNLSALRVEDMDAEKQSDKRTWLIHGFSRPCGAFLSYRAEGTVQSNIVSVSGCMLVETPDKEWREETPLYTLLDELRARDAVPRCRLKGFSNPNDDLTERVQAYLSSCGGASDEAYEALRKRAGTVLRILSQQPSGDVETAEWLKDRVMPEREQDKLRRLLELLSNALQQQTRQDELTAYQRATVDHLKKVFDEQDAYLLADEVGLGKTYVARGLIRELGYQRILYVASNSEIAKDNAPELIDAEPILRTTTRGREVKFYPQVIQADRLSMYDANKAKEGETDFCKPVVYPLSPATTFTGRGSPNGNEAERTYYKEHCKNLTDNLKKELKEKLDELKKELDKETSYTEKIIRICRGVFNKKSVLDFDPDLIVLDEFQRFLDLLDPKKKVDQHFSLYELIRTINGIRDDTSDEKHKPHVKLLLLSATPYQYYQDKVVKQYDGHEDAANDEEASAKHFQNFEELREYLLALNGYESGIQSAPSDWQGLYNNDRAEFIYQHILCRTERKWLQGDMTNAKSLDLGFAPYQPGGKEPLRADSRSRARLKKHLDHCGEYQKSLMLGSAVTMPTGDSLKDNRVSDSAPLTKANGGASIQSYANLRAYLDEAPEYAQFGDGYSTITKGSKGQNSAADKLREAFSDLLSESGCRIRKQLGSDEPDSAFHIALQGHAKWDALLELAMPESAELRLWVPPIATGDTFAKTLVFAHYRVSTRSVAALLSMEAQRRLLERIGTLLVPDKVDVPDKLLPTCVTDQQEREQLKAAICTFFNTTHARRVLTAWAAKRQLSVDERGVLAYCEEYHWSAMLEEYLECLNKLRGVPQNGALSKLLPTLISALNWTDDDRTRVLVLPDWAGKGYPCTYADRYTEDYSDKKAHDEGDNGEKLKTIGRLSYLKERFQSPFYPFVLAASETAQEGVNLHNYCDTLIHWSVPSRLNTMVQEEGRIDRRGCMTLRRQAYWLWAHQPDNQGLTAPGVSALFDVAEDAYQSLGWSEGTLGKLKQMGLFPLWFLPTEPGWTDFPRLRRAMLFLPETADQAAWESLLDAQAVYHTFGIEGSDGNLLSDDNTLRDSICPLFREVHAAQQQDASSPDATTHYRPFAHS